LVDPGTTEEVSHLSNAEPLVIVDANVLGRQRTGDESYVENLLRELAPIRDGITIGAVTSAPGRVPPGIEPIAFNARSQALRMFVRMPRLLRSRRPDLAHFQYVVPPGLRLPSVVTVHDISFADHDFSPLHDRLAMRALVPRSMRRARRILTVSEWTRAQIIDRYNISAERIVVTPNGVDPVFTPEGARPDGPPYILFVGAIEPRKDPVLAVESLARLGDDARMIMVGPPKRAIGALRAAIQRLGLSRRVDLRGYVTKDELAVLYRGAACLLFPSRYEGFGLPLLEAMACGTPVVATRAGAIPEVAGGAAVLVERDPDAIADGIRHAEGAREQLRAAGIARASQFSWADTARRTLAAYRDGMS
jgi:glycosyltransferase involved in cell wall biosynthesis